MLFLANVYCFCFKPTTASFKMYVEAQMDELLLFAPVLYRFSNLLLSIVFFKRSFVLKTFFILFCLKKKTKTTKILWAWKYILFSGLKPSQSNSKERNKTILKLFLQTFIVFILNQLLEAPKCILKVKWRKLFSLKLLF